jgi:hypothetical protein
MIGLIAAFIIATNSSLASANPDCSIPGAFYCQNFDAGQWASVDHSAATCHGADTSQSHSPSYSLVQRWEPHQDSCGFYYLPDFQPTKQVYLRWYQYMSSGWNCVDSYASKDFIIHSSRAPSTDWGTGVGLQLSDGVFGKCGLSFRPLNFNEPFNSSYFFQNQSRDVDFSLNPQRWYCIEVHVGLNNVNQSNGVIEAWVDNNLVMRHTGNFTPEDDYFRNVEGTGSKINASPFPIARWTDDIVISTQRIGCLGAVPSPAPAPTPTPAIDTTPPTIQITSPANGQVVQVKTNP